MTVGHNVVIHSDAGPITPAVLAAVTRLDSAGGACDEDGMDGDCWVRGRTCLITHVRPRLRRPKTARFVLPLPRFPVQGFGKAQFPYCNFIFNLK